MHSRKVSRRWSSNSRLRLKKFLKNRKERISKKGAGTVSAIRVDLKKKSDRPSSIFEFFFAPLFSHRFAVVELHYTFAISFNFFFQLNQNRN